MNRTVMLAALSVFLVAGCDSDPLGPVASPVITLTVNSMNASDIEAGIIDKDENISTETGNPWGEFIRQAEGVCAADPVAFEVTSASLALDAGGSSGVEALDEVLTGSTRVIFRSTQGSDADATQVEIASGTGPSALVVTATRTALTPLLERLQGGDFHVAVQGETTRQEGEDFSMDVLVSFTVAAFCE